MIYPNASKIKKATKSVYIHSIYTVNASFLQNRVFILWVSYGYVMVILWYWLVIESILSRYWLEKDGMRREWRVDGGWMVGGWWEVGG